MSAVREFSSMGEFALHLASMELAIAKAGHKALDRAAQLIEADAKQQIGEYQPAVGGFAEWAPLAQSTEAEKERLGYPADAPLLREGDLRDSISREVHESEAVVGSTSDIAVYQELGTSAIPPRPFIGPAAVKNREAIERLIGQVVFGGVLLGEATPAGDYFK